MKTEKEINEEIGLLLKEKKITKKQVPFEFQKRMEEATPGWIEESINSNIANLKTLRMINLKKFLWFAGISLVSGITLKLGITNFLTNFGINPLWIAGGHLIVPMIFGGFWTNALFHNGMFIRTFKGNLKSLKATQKKLSN